MPLEIKKTVQQMVDEANAAIETMPLADAMKAHGASDVTFIDIRDPRELIFAWKDNKRLPMGTVMFCGTMPAIGGIRSSSRFEMELEDPVLGRTITHAYDIEVLPIIA